MVERNAPPYAAASLPAADEASRGDTVRDTRWPPRGWPMFACVTRKNGTATCCDRGAESAFLQYELAISPEGIYTLEIFCGRIGRSGTSLAPALGIRFADREDWLDENPQNAVLEVHVRGQNLIPERSLVLRAILAITYIVSRIDRGAAPNLKRVLKIYRLA